MTQENQRLITHKGYTLVDITNTGVIKYTVEQAQQRDQQRNWETVLQILSMRTQLFRVEQVDVLVENVKQYNFGSAYQGKQRIWSFEFDIEFQNAILLDDFKTVPIITGLSETVVMPMQLFYTSGENKNIYFKTLN
jgi:hypothetical protein